MKRGFWIVSTVVIVFLAGSVFAEDAMVKTKEKEVEISTPMMKGMMGGSSGMGGGMMQGMMGGQGMMSGGMMCPMCGKMMGGGMMPMMQGMMGGMGMMDAKPHIAGMAEALKLSQEQQDKLNALHIAYQKDIIRKKADKEIAEIDLQELIKKDESGLDAVEKKLQEIGNLETQIRYAWVKLMVDSKSLLTTEQKAEFKKLMKGQKGPMMMGQMMGGQGIMSGKKAESGKPASKTESGGHEEHH